MGPWLGILLGVILLGGDDELPDATAPVPWAGHDVDAADAGEPTILFVNFDGAVLRNGCGNDAHFDCSTLADTFDGYVGPFGGNNSQRAAILQAVRKHLAPFGVTTVAKRPPLDVDYTMVLYGDLGSQGFAGIAPYIDCGDVWKADTSFSQGYKSANQGATVILQEAAHTWGLEHVNQPNDILHPVTEGVAPGFVDACEKIVSNTSLDETSGVCNLVHTRFCEAGYQNSHQEMEYLFGPSSPDTQSPVVEIVSPAPDSVHELPAVVSLRADISDNFDPQFYALSVYLDEELIFETDVYDDLEVAFQVKEPGEYDVRVVATDDAGNAGEGSVTFTYVPEGELEPQLEPQGCSVADHARSNPWWLLALWSLRRRRR